MKLKNIIAISLFLMGIFGISSCRTNTTISEEYAFMTYETECLGVELDGSQTLRAWGKGKDKADAIEQAKKNALRDVIFKGITSGSGECNKRALILEVNAQEKYEYYFNVFFRDGGEYTKYVTNEDENLTSRVKAKSSTQQNYGVVVRVKRAELRQRLIDDNIIKP
ncbi:MAG: hypothetical protein IKV32_05825 [Muribaculaceae bacterium]|nr:hypothetical protein [Muribaculaceae bacterium]